MADGVGESLFTRNENMQIPIKNLMVATMAWITDSEFLP